MATSDEVLRPASKARIALEAALLQCVEAGVPAFAVREVVDEVYEPAPTGQEEGPHGDN